MCRVMELPRVKIKFANKVRKHMCRGTSALVPSFSSGFVPIVAASAPGLLLVPPTWRLDSCAYDPFYVSLSVPLVLLGCLVAQINISTIRRILDIIDSCSTLLIATLSEEHSREHSIVNCFREHCYLSPPLIDKREGVGCCPFRKSPGIPI